MMANSLGFTKYSVGGICYRGVQGMRFTVKVMRWIRNENKQGEKYINGKVEWDIQNEF